MTAFAGIDVRLWQAVIAGAVVAVGWIVNGWQNRAEARALKAEKLRDAHKALFAEIRTTLAQLDESGSDVTDSVIARMKDDDSFVPFIPREEHDVIFQTVLGQIDVLPRETIDVVVAYYGVARSMAALAEDMRGERFSALTQDRRIAVYRDYVETRRRMFLFGEVALSAIEAYARAGSDAAKRAIDKFSTLDEARDVHRDEAGSD